MKNKLGDNVVIGGVMRLGRMASSGGVMACGGHHEGERRRKKAK